MSKLIAIRVPDDLAARLDTRCSIRKQSKTDVLLEAIERGWNDAPIPTSHGPLPQAEPIPAVHKPTMDALRSICAGNVPRQVDHEHAEDCTPECCECGHKLTVRVVKGVVVAWACPDLGCPMYGLERGDD